jgi:hypothetical protein
MHEFKLKFNDFTDESGKYEYFVKPDEPGLNEYGKYNTDQYESGW